MTVRQFLQRGRKIQASIASKTAILEGLNSMIFSLLTEEKKKALEAEILDELNGFLDVRLQVKTLIDTLDDLEQRAVLECYYLSNMTWDETARKLFMGARSVHYRHNNALEFLKGYLMQKAG